MADIAEQARFQPDARIRKLVEWIRQNLMNNDRWNDRRVLIFTEYEDTLRHLRQQLEGELKLSESGVERLAAYQCLMLAYCSSRGLTTTGSRSKGLGWLLPVLVPIMTHGNRHDSYGAHRS